MTCPWYAAPIIVLLLAGSASTSAQTIASLSPNPAPQGSTLSIVGTGFGTANANSYVKVNGATVSYATWSNTLITVPVPTNSPVGTGPLSVLVNGVSSNSVNVTVSADPVISSLTPSPTPQGAVLTIAGNNFGAAANTSYLTLNGSSYPYASWSNTAITADVPTNSPTGSGTIGVTVGGIASNPEPFTIVTPPNVTGVNPNPAPQGSTLSIAGSNFGSASSTSYVHVNGANIPYTTWSNTLVTVPVPDNSPTGNGPVGIVVGGVESNITNLQVTNTPYISFSPSTGPPNMGFVITLNNIGSGGTPTVTFNGVSVPTFSTTSSSVTIQVPAGAATGNATVKVTSGSVTAQNTFAVIADLGCPTS